MLALTKRPKTISEMVGQNKILKFMKESSKDLSFPQSMLFDGNSGSGKSTLAFIIAKTINCKNPIKNKEGYYDPCNECKSCKDVLSTQFERDILYLDASKMGKAEVSELTSFVERSPMYDNKRVLIIDEAHLLNSKEARGAMLLLLEKPREHVIFILCTTDVSKFDNAFMNRLQRFQFKPLNSLSIGEYLSSLFNQQISQWDEEGEDIEEGIKIGDQVITQENIKSFGKEVIPLLSTNSKGELRQAIQYYEQCIKMFIFTKEEALEILVLFDSERAEDMMIEILTTSNISLIFKYLEEVDIEFFYNYFYKIIHEAIVYNETKEIIDSRRENLYVAFSKSNRMYSMLDLFIKIEENRRGYYFNKRYLISKIMLFVMDNSPSNFNPRKLEEKPRRKTVQRVKHQWTD